MLFSWLVRPEIHGAQAKAEHIPGKPPDYTPSRARAGAPHSFCHCAGGRQKWFLDYNMAQPVRVLVRRLHAVGNLRLALAHEIYAQACGGVQTRWFALGGGGGLVDNDQGKEIICIRTSSVLSSTLPVVSSFFTMLTSSSQLPVTAS